MTRTTSLRTRLVGLAILAVATVWLVTAVVTWHEARASLDHLLTHPPATTAPEHMELDREYVVSAFARHMLKPMVLALPALAILLAIAIGIALRPLHDIARAVAERAPDRLDPLPIDAVPAEAAPLVGRLNSLFADITRAIENERRFTADAAHELRTPLAALRAQAQVAQAADDSAVRQRALAQILVGCDRATHLVEQLLTLARIDALQPDYHTRVDLHALAGEVLAAAAGTALERHCELALDDGSAWALGDALLLQVLLRNLIDNALRHSGASRIVVTPITRGDEACLIVSDNGRGIPEHERQHVQQRFYRAVGTESAGSGLGLSIVQRITELHRGSIELAAADQGSGLKVTLHLPGSPAAASAAA